ncbi:hypothetical protein ACI77O_12565 [Pseudomonas tritici]|uniref:hypothetical protein n=1 Tax=Pseudomonas tritici TaxID=2745518 RepID=UPI00387B0498
MRDFTSNILAGKKMQFMSLLLLAIWVFCGLYLVSTAIQEVAREMKRANDLRDSEKRVAATPEQATN